MRPIFTMILLSLAISGCETTNSYQYKASIPNVVAIQESIQTDGQGIALGTFKFSQGTKLNPLCRLIGDIDATNGMTIPEYIKQAFQEELFLAKAYDHDAPTTLNAVIEHVEFSSFLPANWHIKMRVKSNHFVGYVVEEKHEFSSSWTAFSACQNVATALAPAVQKLLNNVITHPDFDLLLGRD